MATQQKGGRDKGEEPSGKIGAVDAEIDALFQLPQPEFTAARNALSARLKKAGRADDADQVKALTKPPVTAWTVNQLYWKHRDAFDRLIDTGERFRKAQGAQLAGKSTDIRAPLEARRAALAQAARLAADVLRKSGGGTTPDNMRRITTTLEALSAYGALAEAPRAGRLTDDVDSPGFETLASLVPRVGGDGSRGSGPTHVLPFHQKAKAKTPKGKITPEEQARQAAEERKAQIAAAKTAFREAERTLRDARKEAQQAEERLKKAAASAKDADRAKTEAEQRFERATADAETARAEARRVAAEAEEAAQALQDAERAHAKATRELEEIDSV